MREYEANCETAEKQHFEKFKSEAALHADTGQTILIATYDLHEEESYLFEGNEIRILTNWWELVSAALRCGSKLAGVNTHDFDLPFLIRRSWLLGVRVPHGVVDLTTKWMNFAPNFVDLRQVWQIGNKSCPSSFDRIGKAFGTGGKCEGDHGAEFAALYATDPDKARAYAINDVIQPAMWLSRFGLVKKVIDLNHEKECCQMTTSTALQISNKERTSLASVDPIAFSNTFAIAAARMCGSKNLEDGKAVALYVLARESYAAGVRPAISHYSGQANNASRRNACRVSAESWRQLRR